MNRSACRRGNSILLSLARRLRRILRPQDSLGRIGGDEFAIILVSESEPERITAFADTVRRTLATPFTFGDREIYMKCSIGLTLADAQTGTTKEDVLRNAELAQMNAKKLGGDRIQVFRPAMRQARDERLMIETDLRRALERNEIVVVFQPIVRLEDRTIAGFERLLRWDHPRLGRLSPKDFLSIAEETGLIIELGAHVLDKQHVNYRSGSRRWMLIRRFLPASMCRAGNCCVMICCKMSKMRWHGRASFPARSNWNSPKVW